MKEGKGSILIIILVLIIGGIVYANGIKLPFGNTSIQKMNGDLVGAYNCAEDFKISISLSSDEGNVFQYIDATNSVDDNGTFEKFSDGVYSLEGTLIEKQEIHVLEDFSFEMTVNGKTMLFNKVSQEPIWITIHKQ